MTGIITKAQAAAKVAFFLDLEEKVAAGQKVRHGDRDLTRADAEWVGSRLKHWQQLYDQIAANEKGHDRRVAFADWHST